MGEFSEEASTYNVTVAQLSGQLGSLQKRATGLEQDAEKNDRDFAAEKSQMEVQIGSLRAERDAWQRRLRDFEDAEREAEKELAELDELASKGVEERRQLQAECLSLQQECEDAKLELQETQDLLKHTGYTVERMVRQKLDLEWELQEQTTKHKVLQSVLLQAGHTLAQEAEEATRQRESLLAAGRAEIDKERARSESFRIATVAAQREIDVVHSERARLEREAAAHAKELQRLEQLKRDFEERRLCKSITSRA